MKKRRIMLAGAAATLILGSAVLVNCAHGPREKMEVPEHPLLNDAKCLLLSPYYVPRNTIAGWFGYIAESATFFSSTAVHGDGSKVSVPMKIVWGATVMPLTIVGGLPVAFVAGGVAPFIGHVADLFTAPFGKPLRFVRLDGTGLNAD
jgi:hypothetical protein